mmetsp:Transcript_86221/g.136089  ORF Transcript_86221/g.136089 Transcript_86221/m.136089 type:complete len:118 (+) Transcript_86221:86-439(+)
MLSGTVVANTPQDSMHLRIKRKSQTVFLLCYPEQLVGDVKQKIGLMFDRQVDTFRLIYKDNVLQDDATIRAQQVSPNDIVQLVYKLDGREEYEKPEWADLDRLHAEYEAKMRSESNA